MNLNPLKLWPKSTKPPVKIIARRNMQMEVGGKSQHVASGSEVEIEFDVFRQLEATDFQLVSLNQPKLEVEDPTPERPSPAPLPARWESLPVCFREYHQIDQELETARAHVRLIREKRMEIFGTNISFAQGEGKILVGSVTASHDQRDRNVYSTLKPVDFDSPTNKKLDRFLTTAETAAVDHLARLIETKDLPQQRLFLECGSHRIDTTEKLQSLITELAETGYQIFSLRLQALELHESHIRKLYTGSGVYAKYSSHAPAPLGGVCWGGYDDSGTPRRYSDLPVESTACHILTATRRIAELAPILKQAKAELARAQKASMPAGLPA